MQPVFRKTSLERLASPERLDQLTQVTTPRGWIGLGALYLVLATGIVWSVLGELPEKVTGQGILVKTGGVLTVIPAAAGRLVDVQVNVGDAVTEGQVVGRLEQPEITTELLRAKASLIEFRTMQEQLVRSGARDLALQTAYINQQGATTRESIAASERSAQSMREKVAAQERLVAQGLVTRATLLNTRQQYDGIQENISQRRGELTRLAAQALEISDRQSRDVREGAFKLRAQEQEVLHLEREFDEKSAVRSPYTGRILELLVESGDVIGRGEPIMSLDLAGRAVKDLEAVIYVPPIDGKRIKPGMAIHIAPATVKQEEFGLMLGRVTYVSDFPATAKGMQRVLKNEQLVNGLANGSAPYEVHADLLVDPSTQSRYQWSSSHGPPVRIQSGTLATGSIVVSVKRPVQLVMPLLRQYTGL